MKYGRWRMRYRLTFPIRGNGCGWEAPLQSKWDSLQPVTLFQEIALEPSPTKEKYSLAKSILRLRTNTLLRRPNSLQKTQCFYVPTLVWPRISGYYRLAHRSFRSMISRLPPRHEVPPSLLWQVPYPVSSRGRSIQLSPQLRRDKHIVMLLHWYPKVRNAKCSWRQKNFWNYFLTQKKPPDFFRSGGGTNKMLV